MQAHASTTLVYKKSTVETGTATVIISIGTDKDTTVVIKKHQSQCCGAETICFGSSSGSSSEFQKFPLRLQICGYLFAQLLNNNFDFSLFLGKNIDLIHLLDPIQYEL
jgi:hypothetical protein